MKFMTLVLSDETQGPPPQALMDAIAKLGEEGTRAGAMVGMGGLYPTAAATRIGVSKGKLTVTDGPFAEVKEVVGGFATFEVGSKAEVVEWTRRFMELHREHWPGWEGTTEIRQLFDGAPER